MEELVIELSLEGAEALRGFAEAIPVAIMNIVQRTEKVVQVYLSVAEEVGPHSQYFYDMIIKVQAAQKMATEAMEILHPKMLKVAGDIEEYAVAHPKIEGN